MSDMLHRGQAWLANKLTRHASRKVTYIRGDLVAELAATIGKSDYEQDDGAGVLTRSQVRDYLIDTASLLASSIASLPRKGDEIHETDSETTHVYEVMSLGGEPPWRYSDPFRVKLRIHAKQIDTIERNHPPNR
jgi:hypothetical protein